MSETPSLVDLAKLDRLYWHTDLPVATVAGRVGLPSRSLHQHVTPLPAGVACYRCGDPLVFTSRSERDGQRLRCRTCGCSRRSPHGRRDPRRSPRPPLGLVGQSLILAFLQLIRLLERPFQLQKPGWPGSHSDDVGADRGEPADEVVVAPVDVGDAADHRLTFGGEAGDHHRRPGADVVGPHRRA